MNNLDNFSKKICIALCICGALQLTGCGKSVSLTDADKGAKSTMLKSAAAYMNDIQFVERDSVYSPVEGLTVTHARIKCMQRPVQLFIAEVDLTKKLSIAAASPNNSDEQKDLQPLSEQMQAAKDAGKDVILGINGDFFEKKPNGKGEFISMNIFAKEGKLIKESYTPDYEGLFMVMKGGNCQIAHPSAFEAVRNDVEDAIGGYQCLVKDGIVTTDWAINDITMKFEPRTMIGLSEDYKKCYFIVMDGKQKEYSEGMRLEQAALFCKGIGCYNAFNLAGGEYSTFVINNKNNGFNVLNKPSNGKERAVINGIIVIKNEK